MPIRDVVVVGGGAIGLAVAWRCAAEGMSVTLLERDRIGAGASGAAAGMLAPISEAERGGPGSQLLELGLRSLERWPEFAAQLERASGVAVGLRDSGTLIAARDRDEAEALERELAFRAALGLAVQRLRPSEARRLEPGLAPTLRLAALVAGDHSVDPRRLLVALAEAARRAGAELREHAAATLAVEDEQVVGVDVAAGRLRAQRTIVCAGAWSGELGVAAAVRPVKGQILRLRGAPGLLERTLRYQGGYVLPRGDGRYVIGATVEERGFDGAVTARAVYELLRDAAELVPDLLELELVEQRAAFRPGTPDNLPLIGPGALPGLRWATGHHRNGILLAPLTADLIAADEVEQACAPARLEAVRA